MEDLPLAVALWSDDGVMRHMGGPQSQEATRDRLQVEMERQNRYGVQYWPVFLRETGAFVGCSGLRPFHDEARVFELGVHIGPRFWSRRLGEEAARAVTGYAFAELKAEALTAGHGPGNIHSKALIGRLGFTYTHDEPWGAQEILHPFYRLAASKQA